MIARRHRPSASISVICGEILSLLTVISAGVLCRDAAAQPPQIVRWEIAATVTYLVDPGGFFPDVRLGDPVRGTLKYDLTLLPNPFYSDEYYYDYTNDTWAAVASMVIENPRGGTEMSFAIDPAGSFADVYVYDDQPQQGGAFDAIFAVQSVAPPPSFVGGAPAVAVQLLGPSSNWTGYGLNFPFEGQSLPATLNLDDFPLSAITFYDAFLEDAFATSIEAEIYSLTPIVTPLLPGDFDFDGDVDGDDLYGWKASYGSTGVLYADGNADGVVNGADFLIWQRQLGATTPAYAATVFVPEPATSMLLIAAAFVLRRVSGRRRQELASE